MISLLKFNTWISLALAGISLACSSSDGGGIPEDDDPGTPQTIVLDDSRNLGVNFNEQLDFIDPDQLNEIKTTWVRGFIDFFKYYNDPSLLNTDPRINQYRSLHLHDFKTVLNIKWLFRGRDYPAAGSPEFELQMDFLKTVLHKIWDRTDIIVVGNEPFIETDDEDKGTPMYDYYVAALNVVKGFAGTQGARPVFFGSFDNMYLPQQQNLEVLNDLLEYARQQPWITGVDLHIHHSATKQMQDALDYVNARIRDDQKILVTEFSLMKHFRLNLDKNIPEGFAAEYGLSPSLRNYEYIDRALKSQVDRGQWVAFLSNSPWFYNRRYYLRNSFNDIFSQYDKFFLATYAIRQSYPFNADFTSATDPWVLNGLYANRTVEPYPDTGKFQFNYAWAEDFIAIQDNEYQD